MRMTGVRPGRRTTSMVRPSIFRFRAQSVIRVTARSMWPCSAHLVSNMGDLAGMRMYSVSAGTMSPSQASWTSVRVRESVVMAPYTIRDRGRPPTRALPGDRPLRCAQVVDHALHTVHRLGHPLGQELLRP